MKLIKESLYEIKKSKFYSYNYEVDSIDEIKLVLENIKKEHKKARHIVYAYKIDGFEKKCEVECEGLAFNELGKVGYNIELSQDLYEMEYEDGIEYTETCAVKNKEIDGEIVYYINPS